MRKILRIMLVLGLIVVLFVLVGLLAVYLALRHEPDWYVQAAATVDRQAEEQASHEMLQRTADLTSSLETKGDWQIAFTAEHINGWLAVDMPKNHPDLLPESLTKPRVVIEEDGVTLACRAAQAGVSTVVSLKVDVYLSEENKIAVRIRKARAGRLPWSLGKVVEGITEAARQGEANMTWRQVEGDPLAIIKIPSKQGSGGRRVRISTLLLEEGRIVVGGSTSAKEE
ncbi:MAG: hypothetical protein U9N87_15130 [Planctomycetota bacterium]|nr:hypothetical protein [Planctomycetota bacterium]